MRIWYRNVLDNVDDDGKASRTTSEQPFSLERMRTSPTQHIHALQSVGDDGAARYTTLHALLFNVSRDARIRFVDWLDAPRSFNTSFS